jgi:sugar phosphate isomerase/epimerase
MTAPANAAPISWGISTLGCAELSLPEICELLEQFGLHQLEIRAVSKRLDLPQWASDAGWLPDRAAAFLARHQVQFCVAGSSFKLVDHDEKSRAELIAFSEWADSWGARYVRVFGGGTWGRSLSVADYDQAIQAITGWRQERKQRGWRIDILLETHDAFSASDPCLELQTRLPAPIGIIWDSHHTWRLGGEPPRESWSKLSPWIRHVQVKDSIVKPSARHPYTYVLPGDGTMPLQEVVELLRKHRFSGAVSLEWERLWHPYLPPLQEALTRLQAQPWYSAAANSSDETRPSANAD